MISEARLAGTIDQIHSVVEFTGMGELDANCSISFSPFFMSVSLRLCFSPSFYPTFAGSAVCSYVCLCACLSAGFFASSFFVLTRHRSGSLFSCIFFNAIGLGIESAGQWDQSIQDVCLQVGRLLAHRWVQRSI